MNISEPLYNALVIISENEGITSIDFAKKLWPQSGMWLEFRTDGRTPGYRLIKSGEQYLKRLINASWVERCKGPNSKDWQYKLTDEGRAVIKQNYAKVRYFKKHSGNSQNN